MEGKEGEGGLSEGRGGEGEEEVQGKESSGGCEGREEGSVVVLYRKNSISSCTVLLTSSLLQKVVLPRSKSKKPRYNI